MRLNKEDKREFLNLILSKGLHEARKEMAKKYHHLIVVVNNPDKEPTAEIFGERLPASEIPKKYPGTLVVKTSEEGKRGIEKILKDH
jgi:hypothetical protein